MKMIRGIGSGGFTRPEKSNFSKIIKKLLKLGPDGQLYDLEADLQEQNNLWNEKPDVVKKMLNDLEVSINTGRTRPKSN